MRQTENRPSLPGPEQFLAPLYRGMVGWIRSRLSSEFAGQPDAPAALFPLLAPALPQGDRNIRQATVQQIPTACNPKRPTGARSPAMAFKKIVVLGGGPIGLFCAIDAV